MYFYFNSMPAFSMRRLIVSAFLLILLCSLSFQSRATFRLFNDTPQNGARLWSTGNSTIGYTVGDEPVASGASAIRLEAADWAKAGLFIGQIPPEGKRTLQAKVYRVAGSHGKLMFRRGNNWQKIDLNDSNNTHWTIDGEPGASDFSADTWHIVEIDLDAFGIEVGEKVTALGIQAKSGSGIYYIDDVAFISSQTQEPISTIDHLFVDEEWEVTFEENFDGEILAPAKWKIGKKNLPMSGIAASSANNVHVVNGELKLTAKNQYFSQGLQNYSYSSGEISTYGLFRQSYGYFEAKIKYDAKQGVWPAFWLMPDRGQYGNDDHRHQALIKFDLDSVSQEVYSAVLRIKVADVNSSNNSLAIHRTLSTEWEESTVTWQSKPQIDPKWFFQRFGLLSGDEIEIDVTNYVQNQKGIGDDASFALVDNYVKQQMVTIHSSEASDETNRPVLLVNGLEVYPSDDVYVRGGAFKTNNYANSTLLSVKSPWSNSTSTFDGGMEFDIMESQGTWGSDSHINALHWDGYSSSHQSEGSGRLYSAPIDNEYHTYSMLWEPGEVTFFVDGVQTWNYADNRVGSVPSYLILSLQLGGWGDNRNILDEDLPANMYVDYVRVWARTEEK